LKQVWFPGAHCDVGGGYSEPESGLSKIALQWMLDEAVQSGLLVDAAQADLVLGKLGRGYALPDPNAMIHDSLKWYWLSVEILWKRHYNWTTGAWERRPNLGA
jgi:hypothetical protein